MGPTSFLLNQTTKMARINAAAFSDSSSPRRLAKSSLRAAATNMRRLILHRCGPANRSASELRNLRWRTLHAAVRAEHAALVRPWAQHLVATPALISQERRDRRHYLFPLVSAYRAGQDRNLDGSASHRAVDPRQEICFRGAIKSRMAARSQSCTASGARIFSRHDRPSRFPAHVFRCPPLLRNRRTLDSEAPIRATRPVGNRKCSGLRNVWCRSLTDNLHLH